jgi:hypothetical protein
MTTLLRPDRALMVAVAQHIAGLPVEEVLLAGAAAMAPMIASVGWELSSRVKKRRSVAPYAAVNPRTSSPTAPRSLGTGCQT